MMRSRVIGLVVLSFFFAGCDQGTKTEEEVVLGYRGQARLNPFLAASRLVEELGYQAETSRSWPLEPYEKDLIFLTPQHLKSQFQWEEAREWVDYGGVLVVLAEGGDSLRDDFDEWSTWIDEDEELLGWAALLESLQVQRVDHDWGGASEEELENEPFLKRPYHLATARGGDWGDFDLELEGEVAFRTRTKTALDLEENREFPSRVVVSEIGYGKIYLISHARPFRNPFIARADHARFLQYLIDSHGAESVTFLYGQANTWFAMVWKHGWPVVISGAILLLLWLWKRIPRFGPILQLDSEQSGGYGHSLTSGARFLWRTKQIESLLHPLQEAKGMPPSRVSKDANDFLQTVKNLQKQTTDD